MRFTDITGKAIGKMRGDASKFAGGVAGHVTLKQIRNGPVITSDAVIRLPRLAKHEMYSHQVPVPWIMSSFW